MSKLRSRNANRHKSPWVHHQEPSNACECVWSVKCEANGARDLASSYTIHSVVGSGREGLSDVLEVENCSIGVELFCSPVASGHDVRLRGEHKIVRPFCEYLRQQIRPCLMQSRERCVTPPRGQDRYGLSRAGFGDRTQCVLVSGLLFHSSNDGTIPVVESLEIRAVVLETEWLAEYSLWSSPYMFCTLRSESWRTGPVSPVLRLNHPSDGHADGTVGLVSMR